MISDTQREAIAKATQISPKLSTAIAEAIQAHADRYSQGKTDFDKVMTALAEVAADFLGSVLSLATRDKLHWAMFRHTSQAAMRKARQHAEHLTEHQQ